MLRKGRTCIAESKEEALSIGLLLTFERVAAPAHRQAVEEMLRDLGGGAWAATGLGRDEQIEQADAWIADRAAELEMVAAARRSS